jgi:hypothetical protein
MAGVLNDESAVRRYRPYRRRATVNSQARACSGVNSRSRRQEDSASANVSAVNSTATSASSVRRAKNNRTLSLSRSYIRENASASSITPRVPQPQTFVTQTPLRRPAVGLERPTHPGRLAIPDRRSRF